MQEFIKTTHCTSKVHCKSCRELVGGRSWRESLSKLFVLPDNNVDFVCPFNKPWNDTKLQVQTIQAVQNTPTKPIVAQAAPRDSGTRTARKGCGCSRGK